MYTQSADTQSSMTPARALRLLEEGNERLTRNLRVNRDLLRQVNDTRDGQWPFAVILSCIDSRVPAELIFDQGVGDILNVRIAGNFANGDVLGSLEFGCKVAGAKLIVVLGHSHCGAIKGACDDVQLGHLTKLLANLTPAVVATGGPTDPSQRSSENPDFVQAVARNNVHLTIAKILEQSPTLRAMHRAGEIDLVGGMYDVERGAVEFMT